MHPRRLRVLTSGLAALALLATGMAPAAAATPMRTFWLLQFAYVATNAAPGATVSVIQVCPRGSVLDRSETGLVVSLATFDSTPAPGYRLRSHEDWVGGNVSRWRVTGRVTTRSGSVLSVAACRVAVPATDTSYTGRVRTKVRIWGPAAAGTALVIDASASGPISEVLCGGEDEIGYISTSHPGGVSTIGATAALTRYGQVVGHTSARVRAGRFAEVGGWWSYRTSFQPQPC